MKQNNIEIVSVVMGAGESRLFAMSGEYFEIIDAATPIDVVLSDFNGAQSARMNQASASFYSKGVSFGVVQITSAAAQTIRFAYGTGETGTRRATGSVTISGAVALDAATLLALEQINVRPEAATGFFSSMAALAVNTPETLFTPAANTNGAILLTAGFTSVELINFMAVFIAKNAAPAAVTDGEVIAQSTTPYSSSNGYSNLTLPSAQFIPAGKGLYFIANTALTASANDMRSARYRLL